MAVTTADEPGRTLVVPIRRYPQLLDRNRWQEHGFESAEDSDLWSDRACGVACVAMILEAVTGQPESVVDLLHEGRRAGAYCDLGWLHTGLADLLTARGIPAAAEPLESVDDLVSIVTNECVAITSTTLHFPEDGSRGGHLVLVHGVTHHDGRAHTIHFSDPSRWGAHNTQVPAQRFAASFTGRIVRTLTPAIRQPTPSTAPTPTG